VDEGKNSKLASSIMAGDGDVCTHGLLPCRSRHHPISSSPYMPARIFHDRGV
jgi:hypothetical protein